MSLKVGIVGLANVGKSTLFNALAESEQAEVGDYPFTTIDPNVAVVKVPDKNLDKLQKFLVVPKKIPTMIEFVDIAGLIKGAHKGEGLGNQFLDHIRRMDALLLVLRAFESKTASFEKISPRDQLEIILEELRQKDRETLVKKEEELRHMVSGDKKLEPHLDLVEKIIQYLDEKKDLQNFYQNQDKEGKKFIRSLFLLSLKPYFLIINVLESEVTCSARKYGFNDNEAIVISAKTEKELNDLDEAEQKEYLEMLGLKEKVLRRIIKKSYQLLDLITFYTYKPKELIQAWSLKSGSSILKAAAKIHTDFAKNFIKAEVINLRDLFAFKSLGEIMQHGKIRAKGKDYEVVAGDLIYIHHQ